MYRTLAFLSKLPHLSTAEFIDYYENHHVPFINSLAGPENMPVIYKRRYTHRGEPSFERLRSITDAKGNTLPEGEGDTIDFDVVTEIVFENEAKAAAWMKAISQDGNATKVREDEEKFLDRGRTRANFVEEFVTCG